MRPYPAWGGPAYGPPQALDPSDEVNMLRREAEAMKRNLDEVNRRIGELEKLSSD